MKSGVLQIDPILSISLTINKHRLCPLLHMPHIISLNLNYIIINQRKLLTIFWKVKTHVIEITDACKVPFMKARDSFVVLYIEERVNWKKNRMVKIYFLKLPAKRFWLTSKSCSWFNKVVYGRPPMKWTP